MEIESMGCSLSCVYSSSESYVRLLKHKPHKFEVFDLNVSANENYFAQRTEAYLNRFVYFIFYFSNI